MIGKDTAWNDLFNRLIRDLPLNFSPNWDIQFSENIFGYWKYYVSCTNGYFYQMQMMHKTDVQRNIFLDIHHRF